MRLTTNPFRGRIGVKDYWRGFGMLIFLIICALVGLIAVRSIPPLLYTIGLLFIAFVFVESQAMTVRRLHDLGISGWLLPLYIVIVNGISIYGYIFNCGTLDCKLGSMTQSVFYSIRILMILMWLALALWPGKSGSNKYGVPRKYATWWDALVGNTQS